MKFFSYMKDGGPLSKVYGYFLAEIKPLFTVVVLNFKDGSREAYHSHAFNSVSWLLKGQLLEQELNGKETVYKPSIFPIMTYRETFHKVTSQGDSWVLSFRGPWISIWKEFLPKDESYINLTHGRKIIAAD